MAKVVLLVFVAFLLLTVLRGLRIFFQAVFRKPGAGPAARRGRTLEGEMVRDPVCGTWIDRKLAVTAQRGSETVSVCSEACLRRLEAG